MQEPHTGLAIGETVTVRGATWRIVDARRFDRCERLDLAGLGADAGTTRVLLYPFDRPARMTPAPASRRKASA